MDVATALRLQTARRPGYDPRDLLKLYLYGYLHTLRSTSLCRFRALKAKLIHRQIAHKRIDHTAHMIHRNTTPRETTSP